MLGDLVCPFCGGTLFITMEARPGHGMFDVPGGIECDNWRCGAEFAVNGKLVKAGNPSPGGDDEPPKASTEPPTG